MLNARRRWRPKRESAIPMDVRLFDRRRRRGSAANLQRDLVRNSISRIVQQVLTGDVRVHDGRPGPIMPGIFKFQKYGQCGKDVSEIFPNSMLDRPLVSALPMIAPLTHVGIRIVRTRPCFPTRSMMHQRLSRCWMCPILRDFAVARIGCPGIEDPVIEVLYQLGSRRALLT
jgi:hypothetical protein